MLLGLGVSSISDAGVAFAQNEKTLHDYYAALDKGILPIKKGYFLDDEDVVFRRHILDISCNGSTCFTAEELPLLRELCFPVLNELQEDGLISFNESGCTITSSGYSFIRNICAAFDLHLLRNKAVTTIRFSNAV